MILGQNGIVRHKDNHIIYQFDVTKCMFSFGNITEKMRMAALDCSNEIVVDLFAGIGYFSLPLLIHAKAKHLYACDWNPHSIDALQKNLILNKVKSDRYTVIEGDNRLFRPSNVAQRVLLGILPSCRKFMKTALECVDKKTGAILHCHDLVETKFDSEIDHPNQERRAPVSPTLSEHLLNSTSSTSTTATAATSIANNYSDCQSLNHSITFTSTNSSLSNIEKLSVPIDELRLQTTEDEEKDSAFSVITDSINNDSNAPNNRSGSGRCGENGENSNCSPNNSFQLENLELINKQLISTDSRSSPKIIASYDTCSVGSPIVTNNNNYNNGLESGHAQKEQRHKTRSNSVNVEDEGDKISLNNELKSVLEARAESLISCIKEELDKCRLNAKMLSAHPVKSYAPHVYHVVFDIELRPSKIE